MSVSDLRGELEERAAQLEASGEYRVLRRLVRRPSLEAEPGEAIFQGLFVDVETTGLDPARDEIIELAMVPFSYTRAGQILNVGEAFQAYRQPTIPIPANVTILTGIDEAKVAGAAISPDAVSLFGKRRSDPTFTRLM